MCKCYAFETYNVIGKQIEKKTKDSIPLKITTLLEYLHMHPLYFNTKDIKNRFIIIHANLPSKALSKTLNFPSFLVLKFPLLLAERNELD